MPGTEGRDHHAAIDAQIEVLLTRMSELQVIETWGPADASVNEKWFIAQEGIVASRWVNRLDRVVVRRPSSSWDAHLIERRKAFQQRGHDERRRA